MVKKHSLVNKIFQNFFLIQFILILILFVFTLGLNYFYLKNSLKQRKKEIIETQKKILKKEIEGVVSSIKFSFYEKNKIIKQNLYYRLKEINELLTSLYTDNKDKESLENLKSSFLRIINGIHFLEENHYFVYDISKRKFLIPPHKYKKLLIKKIISIVENSGVKNEIVPFTIEDKRKKELFEFIFFKPFNWVIGGYIPKEKFIRLLKDDLFNKISTIKFGKNGYVFIIDYSGTVYVYEGKNISHINKKLWEIPNANLVNPRKIFQTGLKIAQNGSGFFRYSYFKNGQKMEKICYVHGINSLNWIIGGSFYYNDVIFLLNLIKIETIQNIKINIFFISILLIGLFSIFHIFNKKTKLTLNQSFKIFTQLLKSSVEANKKIDINKISIKEFEIIAREINKIAGEKAKYMQKIEENRKLLDITLKTITDGVITIDKKGKILLINEIAKKLISSECLTNKKIYEIMPIIKKEQEKFINNINKVLNEGFILTEENYHLHTGKRKYEIEFSAVPIKRLDKIIGAVCVFKDITEKKRQEKELSNIKKLESLALVAGGIAHDFNNLLTGIFGNISVMKAKIDKDSPIYKNIERTEKALHRATNLTNQLLTFAKGGIPSIKTIDIREIIQDVVTFHLSGSNVKPHFYFENNLWSIKADKEQISNVISNLIINAKQAMPKGGNIYISAKNIKITNSNFHNLKEGKYVKITIKDQGIGIKKENLDKIFDPYFTTKPQGSGLGLSIVYSIIKKHGGYITVSSEVGKGTTFDIYIPATTEKIKKAKEKGSSTDKIINKNIRILVMDDEEIVRDVIKDMLNHLGYYNVDLTANGEEAIEKYKNSIEKNNPYEIVILDLTISGGMGGKETLQELKKLNPSIKAIVISGYSSDMLFSEYKKYGFKGILKKPFLIEELEMEIIKLINQD